MEQATLPDVDNLYPKAKRAQSPKSTVSTSLIVGIILVVIALFVCAIVSWLVWRLRRQTRKERGETRQILDPDPFHVSNFGNTQGRNMDAQLYNKPLPHTPSRTSTESLSTFRSLQGRPRSAFQYSPVPSVPPPLQPISRQPNSQVPTFTTPMRLPTSTINSSPTPSRARNQGVPVGDILSSTSTNVASESDPTSDNSRGKFIVVNATESDSPQSRRPQIPYPSEHPPDLKTEFTRGRDLPFPSRLANQRRPAPVTTSLNSARDGALSTVTAYPLEKGESTNAPATPGTSYAIQIPFSQPNTPNPPLTSRLPHTPLTITASQPVSNVVVEDLGPVLRPDGTQGRGRVVALSVLIEDDETERSDGERDPNELWRQGSWARDDYDILAQVVDSYAMDLPPYTPRDEHISISS